MLLMKEELVMNVCEAENSLAANLHVLAEELSIADSVQKVVNEVIRKIKQAGLGQEGTFRQTVHLTNYEFIGDLRIDYTSENLPSENKLLNYYRGEYSSYEFALTRELVDGYAVRDGKLYNAFLEVRFPTIKGVPYVEDFDNAIFHEVEHLYQHYKKLEKGQPYESKTFNKGLYKKAFDNLNVSNKVISAVSRIVYMHDPVEQDGKVNGLYGFIRTKKPKTLEEIDKYYKESNEYLFLTLLKKLKDEIPAFDENGVDYQEAIKFFQKENFEFTKGSLLKLLDSTIKRYQIKIGKILSYLRGEVEPINIKPNRKINTDTVTECVTPIYQTMIDMMDRMERTRMGKRGLWL